MENVIGPLMTDLELYTVLDTERYPSLAECVSLYERGEALAARAVFADAARKMLNPVRFFTHSLREEKPVLDGPLLAKAERAIRHEMVSCRIPHRFDGAVDWYHNPTENGYKEWTWQLSRHEELVNLSRAYRATGDEKYATACAELLTSWIRQAVRPDYTTPGYLTLAWRTIECGIRMGLMWPEIIHTFVNSTAFDDNLIVDYFKSVYEHAVRVQNAFTTGNWIMHELNGLGQSGIYYPIFKDSAAWIELAFSRMEHELVEEQLYPDGSQYEISTSYHGVILHHVTEIIEVAQIYGIPVPVRLFGAIEQMVMHYVRITHANKKMPHPNDGGGFDFRKEILKSGGCFPENEIFRWAISDGKEGREPEFKSVFLEYGGHALLRRDWSFESSAYMDVGPLGRFHQHEDKLNVTIASSERVLLCEADTYAYDTSKMREYCISSRGHNVINVNKSEQKRLPTYKWEREMLSVKANATAHFGADVDWVEGVYDEQFGDGSVSAVHRRRLIMLKNPKVGGPLYIVVDRLFSDTVNEYEAMWHFDVKDAKIEGNRLVTGEITQIILGDIGEMRIAIGETEPVVQGWICRSTAQHSEEAIPTLLHTVTGDRVRTVNIFSLHGAEGTPIADARLDGERLTISYLSGGVDVVELA
ncbi:MAG: heparinase II/III family protein [Clostridia bacterium]|nr:heparinase II/III family protein [Clostridia bacterium]